MFIAHGKIYLLIFWYQKDKFRTKIKQTRPNYDFE